MRFDGMPVESTYFSLKSGSNLPTDRKLPMHAHVVLKAEGRVKGYSYIDGRLTTLVEILDAEIVG